jgi:hypothetical protein
MKTTDFITENENIGSDAHVMHQDHQNQMLREEVYHSAVNAVKLYHALEKCKGIQIDAWAAEKISLANDYLKTVADWLEYEVLAPDDQGMPVMSLESVEADFDKLLSEDATGGAMSAASVPAVVTELGAGSNPMDMIKRQQGYTNVLQKPGTDVKAAKPKGMARDPQQKRSPVAKAPKVRKLA